MQPLSSFLITINNLISNSPLLAAFHWLVYCILSVHWSLTDDNSGICTANKKAQLPVQGENLLWKCLHCRSRKCCVGRGVNGLQCGKVHWCVNIERSCCTVLEKFSKNILYEIKRSSMWVDYVLLSTHAKVCLDYFNLDNYKKDLLRNEQRHNNSSSSWIEVLVLLIKHLHHWNKLNNALAC